MSTENITPDFKESKLGGKIDVTPEMIHRWKQKNGLIPSDESSEDAPPDKEPPAVKHGEEPPKDEAADDRPTDKPAEGDDKPIEENLFDDLFKQTEEVPDEKFFDRISQKIGKPISGESDIIELLSSKSEAPASAVEYSTPELGDFVKRAEQITKDGGDFRLIVEKENEIAVVESDITALNKRRDILKKAMESSSLEDKEAVLVNHFINDLQISRASALEQVEQMKDSNTLSIEANRVIRSELDKMSGTEVSLNNHKTALRKALDDSAAAVAEQRDIRTKRINEIVNGFEDPDHKSFGEVTRKAAKAALNSDHVPMSIPKGLAKMLFLGEDGKMDYSKITSLINLYLNAGKKMDVLLKNYKKESFKQRQNYKPDDKSKMAGGGGGKVPIDKKGKDAFDTTFQGTKLKSPVVINEKK